MRRQVFLRVFLAIFLVGILPELAFAEVMDKELSVTDIWVIGGLSILLCLAVTAVHRRWLLLLSYIAVHIIGFTFPWTEWYSPDVGPDIRIEAGPSYGFHAQAMASIVVAEHLLGFVYLTYWSKRYSGETKQSKLIHVLAFGAIITAMLALTVSGGFRTSNGIWYSPPFLVIVVFSVCVIALACPRPSKGTQA